MVHTGCVLLRLSFNSRSRDETKYSLQRPNLSLIISKPQIKREPGTVLYPSSTNLAPGVLNFTYSITIMTGSLLFGKKGPNGSRSLFP